MEAESTILGLSLGTRKIGTAWLVHTELHRARMWAFPGIWSAEKLYKVMQKLDRKVKRCHITAISLKIPSPSHHTAGIRALLAAIRKYCDCHYIRLHICTIHDIKVPYAIGRRHKKHLMCSIAEKHPRLYKAARKELTNRNTYHTKMFEAVAAAELLQSLIAGEGKQG
jgi:hypothetical protein